MKPLALLFLVCSIYNFQSQSNSRASVYETRVDLAENDCSKRAYSQFPAICSNLNSEQKSLVRSYAIANNISSL